jgi:phage gpG-like protein
MAIVVLDVKITTAEVDEWFVYAGYHVRDARSPLRRSFNMVILPSIKARMENEGYGEWEDLTEEYLARKIADGYGGKPILERTGKGKRDIFSTPPVVHQDEMMWAPDNDYMHWHQSGGYVEGRPPQRTWLELDVDDEEQIDGIFQTWLDELADHNSRRSPDLSYQAPVPMYDILGA